MKTRKAIAVLALASFALATVPAAFGQTPTTGAIPVAPSKPATKKPGSATAAKAVKPAPAKAAAGGGSATKTKTAAAGASSAGAGASGGSEKGGAAPGLAAKGGRSIVGEVVDPACWVVNGAKGASHKDCAVACAKAGQVLAILESKTQKLYLVATDKPGEDPNKGLIDYVGQTVTARGRVYARGGVTAIKITAVEPAAAKGVGD
jgi:hypothetical protein